MLISKLICNKGEGGPLEGLGPESLDFLRPKRHSFRSMPCQGPKFSIFRAHLIQWPSKWICPQQNQYDPRHKTGTLIIVSKTWILKSLTLKSVSAWISSCRGLWRIWTLNASPLLARYKRPDTTFSQLTYSNCENQIMHKIIFDKKFVIR